MNSEAINYVECNRCNGYSTFPLTRAHTREGKQKKQLHRLHGYSGSMLRIGSDDRNLANAAENLTHAFGSFPGTSRTGVIRAPLFEVL